MSHWWEAVLTQAGMERRIYPNLKLRMYTTGMRQKKLAKLVGIGEANLSRILNGIREPRQQMRQEIATVLGCDAEWLFKRTVKEAGNIVTNAGLGEDLQDQYESLHDQ
jgi:transcriptional regulator with XRE-family HTH domain